MTSLAQVRDGIDTLLDAIPGLRAINHVPGDAPFPAALVEPPTIADYRADLGAGGLTVTFQIDVLVSAATHRNQLELYPYLERTGTKSIWAAFEANRSLGFTDVDAHVISAESLGLTEIAGTQCFGSAVTVQVSLGG
jgi:hypothetical protein